MDTAVVPCFWEVSPSDGALNIHCLASDMPGAQHHQGTEVRICPQNEVYTFCATAPFLS